MKKKLISKTYLRDVEEYTLKIYFDNEDYYLCVKKIIKTKPFITSKGLRLIDNDYYIVEVIPKNEFYAMRVYFNEKKERLAYYFDISKGNGVDEESKIPYYDDLYIDVTMDNNNIKVLDEDELQFALETKNITKEEYNLANKIKDKLLNEIRTNTNKYINLDLEKYL